MLNDYIVLSMNDLQRLNVAFGFIFLFKTFLQIRKKIKLLADFWRVRRGRLKFAPTKDFTHYLN